MSAPNAQERKACWGARDEFWKCLDYNRNDATVCETYKKEFEANCPTQWVKYFNKRRDFLKYKEKIENEGFESAERTSKL